MRKLVNPQLRGEAAIKDICFPTRCLFKSVHLHKAHTNSSSSAINEHTYEEKGGRYQNDFGGILSFERKMPVIHIAEQWQDRINKVMCLLRSFSALLSQNSIKSI
jgi:hypothetical protein